MCLVYKNVLQYIYICINVFMYTYIYMYMYWNMYVRKTDGGLYISKNKKIYSGTKCVDMDDIYIYIYILI